MNKPSQFPALLDFLFYPIKDFFNPQYLFPSRPFHKTQSKHNLNGIRFGVLAITSYDTTFGDYTLHVKLRVIMKRDFI